MLEETIGFKLSLKAKLQRHSILRLKLSLMPSFQP